jgi:Type IV secretion system pilin
MNLLTRLAVTLNADELNIPKSDPNIVLQNGLNIAYFVAGLGAVLVIVIAGFMLTAGGSDPATLTKAKNSILFAVIGLVVIIMAAVITQFLLGRAAA